MPKTKSLGGFFFSSKYILLTALLVVILGAGLALANVYLSRPTQVGSQASTGNNPLIPAADQRATVPVGAQILNNGTGITNQAPMTAGNFQVEGYCTQKNLGAVAQTNTNWSCGGKNLQMSDYDAICALTYPSYPNAFAIRSATGPTPAFNLRCYSYPAGYTPTPSPAASVGPVPSGTPLGTPAPGTIACGSPCGGQNNGQLLKTNCQTGTVCGNSQNGGTSDNRCIPFNTPGYVSRGGSCKNDSNTAVFCLSKTDGTPVTDAAGILAACKSTSAGGTTTTPTATPTSSGSGSGASAGISDLNHNGKADPDDYRLFLEDYRNQLSKQ
jgi:hypothetical protein